LNAKRRDAEHPGDRALDRVDIGDPVVRHDPRLLEPHAPLPFHFVIRQFVPDRPVVPGNPVNDEADNDEQREQEQEDSDKERIIRYSRNVEHERNTPGQHTDEDAEEQIDEIERSQLRYWPEFLVERDIKAGVHGAVVYMTRFRH